MNGTAEFGAHTRVIGHPTVSAETSKVSDSHALSRCCASSAGWATAESTTIAGEDYTAASATLVRRAQGTLEILTTDVRRAALESNRERFRSAYRMAFVGNGERVRALAECSLRSTARNSSQRNIPSLRGEHRQNVHSDSDRLARPHREMEQA